MQHALNLSIFHHTLWHSEHLASFRMSYSVPSWHLQLCFKLCYPFQQFSLAITLCQRLRIYGRHLCCHAYPVHGLLCGLLQICGASALPVSLF